MTRTEKKKAIDIILEGVNKIEERNKSNYKRGLITADEEETENKRLYQTMAELIKLLFIEAA